MYKQYCETGCGLGAPNGKCVWRQGNDGGGLESKYSTCTPDLHTCPDQVCDPLERAFHLLCPQDCTSKPTIRYCLHFQNMNYKRD